MQVIFRSWRSLYSVLSKVKDPLLVEKQSKVVYRIPCSCGKAYISETKRRLETKLKEQRWEEATVVDKAKHPEELPLKEALHIHMTSAFWLKCRQCFQPISSWYRRTLYCCSQLRSPRFT